MKNILALLADFANGIFAVLIVAYFYGIDPAGWYFLVGIMFSMSPDIDAIPELLVRGRVSASGEHLKDHRTFLHYPIISIPLGLVMWYFFSFWGALWLVAVLLHLINDLYGTGWGLKLLYPFKKCNYKFFARRINRLVFMQKSLGAWVDLPKDETRLRVVVSWSKEELPDYIRQYGVDRWIDLCYLNLNSISLVEYFLFAVAVVLMGVSLLY